MVTVQANKTGKQYYIKNTKSHLDHPSLKKEDAYYIKTYNDRNNYDNRDCSQNKISCIFIIKSCGSEYYDLVIPGYKL